MFLSSDFEILKDSDFKNKVESLFEKKLFYIWGQSTKNQNLFNVVPHNYFSGVFDNKSSDWGKKYYNLTVKEFSSEKEDCCIVSAVGDPSVLILQLRNLGVREFYIYIEDSVFEKSYPKALDFYHDSINKFVFSEKKCKYLHVIPDEKFIVPLIHIVSNYFDVSEHAFVIYSFNRSNFNDQYNVRDLYLSLEEKGIDITILGALFYLDPLYKKRIHRLKNMVANCYRIIFHGEGYVGSIISVFQELTEYVKEKGLFIPWGAILSENKSEFVAKILKYCPLVVKTTSDLYLQKLKEYNFENYSVINTNTSYAVPMKLCDKKVNKINVLISNSCNSCNNIENSLNAIKKFAGQICVYCICSYGDVSKKSKQSLERIKSLGELYFGGDFIFIDKFMPLSEYSSFISKINVAVFSSEEGNAMVSIRMLSYAGAKIYIKPNCKTSEILDGRNIKWSDINHISKESFEEFCFNKYEDDNRSVVDCFFNENIIVPSWKKIFD